MFRGDYNDGPSNKIGHSYDWYLVRYIEEIYFDEWLNDPYSLTKEQGITLATLVRRIQSIMLNWMWDYNWLKYPEDGDEEKQIKEMRYGIFGSTSQLIELLEKGPVDNLKMHTSLYDFEQMVLRRYLPPKLDNQPYLWERLYDYKERNGYLPPKMTWQERELNRFDPTI